MPRLLATLALLVIGAHAAHAQGHHPPAGDETGALASVALPPELDRVLRDYERGWRNRDADALAALFTPDGFILRPGHDPVRGRAQIAEAYRNAGGPLHLRALSYAQADSVAYIIGGYATAQEHTDAGKFILTLRQVPDGRWYITADMDNANP